MWDTICSREPWPASADKRGQVTLVFDPAQKVPDQVLKAIIDQ